MSDIKFIMGTLEINITELYDRVTEEEKNFPEVFDRMVQEYIVNSAPEDERYDPDGVVITESTFLEHDEFSEYIDVDLYNVPNPWYHLGTELDVILEFAQDDKNRDKTIGYLALLNDGWKWESITYRDLRERMSNFRGLYTDLIDVVNELITEGDIEPIPDYVVYDEDATAEEAEQYGYFSSFQVNWSTHAVWQ